MIIMKHLFPTIIMFRNSPSSDASSQELTLPNICVYRLSSVRYFSSKKVQEGDSLRTHEKLPVSIVLQQESKQTKSNLKNCVYMWILASK